jgi:hypothetical protein
MTSNPSYSVERCRDCSKSRRRRRSPDRSCICNVPDDDGNENEDAQQRQQRYRWNWWMAHPTRRRRVQRRRTMDDTMVVSAVTLLRIRTVQSVPTLRGGGMMEEDVPIPCGNCYPIQRRIRCSYHPFGCSSSSSSREWVVLSTRRMLRIFLGVAVVVSLACTLPPLQQPQPHPYRWNGVFVVGLSSLSSSSSSSYSSLSRMQQMPHPIPSLPPFRDLSKRVLVDVVVPSRRSSTTTTTNLLLMSISSTSNQNPNDLSERSRATSTTTPWHQYTIKELRNMVRDAVATTVGTASTATTIAVTNTTRTELPLQQQQQQQPSNTGHTIVWSKFKRKQDYIDYLVFLQHPPPPRWNRTKDAATHRNLRTNPTNPDTIQNHRSIAKKNNQEQRPSAIVSSSSSFRVRHNMPPLATPTSSSSSSNYYKSPKEYIFEQVYQRYPPIRPTTTTATSTATSTVAVSTSSSWSTESSSSSSSSSNMDVRQEYHPVMRQLAHSQHGSSSSSSSSSSTTTSTTEEEDPTSFAIQTADPMASICVQADMDIVCIGTASCTPGVTRGVSCTAVRLNWNRRSTATSTSASVVVTTPPSTPPGTTTIPEEEDDTPHKTGLIPEDHHMMGATTPRTASTFQSGTWIFDVGECTQVNNSYCCCCCVVCVRNYTVSTYITFADDEIQRCWHQSEYDVGMFIRHFDFVLNDNRLLQ